MVHPTRDGARCGGRESVSAVADGAVAKSDGGGSARDICPSFGSPALPAPLFAVTASPTSRVPWQAQPHQPKLPLSVKTP
jgi:hypothetical protein